MAGGLQETEETHCQLTNAPNFLQVLCPRTLGPDDVKFQGRLSECQEHAGRGLYAQAIAAYVQWIAPQYEQIIDWRNDEAARVREEINAGAGCRSHHKRTPTAVADLTTGFRLFLRFAQEIGAISPEQAADLSSRCWQALLKTAAEQAGHQEASDPSSRYMDLLRSVLSSGRAHVLTRDGQRPAESAEAWGWRRHGVASGTGDDWHPQGKCIGWLDEENLYLDPDAAYAEANRLAAEQGGSLAVSKDTLHKRLAEQHWLASTDPVRQRRTIRRMLLGWPTRRSTSSLRASFMSGGNRPNRPDCPFGRKKSRKWYGCVGRFAKARDNHPSEPSHFFRRNRGIWSQWDGWDSAGSI